MAVIIQTPSIIFRLTVYQIMFHDRVLGIHIFKSMFVPKAKYSTRTALRTVRTVLVLVRRTSCVDEGTP